MTSNMNNSLTKKFTKDEVVAALKQMAHLKFLGPNGFNPNFYQSYRHIVGEEATSVILAFLNDGLFDSCINFTYIVLIPKIKNPVKASNFRPISLCNIIYKLVLANRLKKILPFIISNNQSAFLLGRLITDNIIIAYEAFHSIKTRRKGKEGSMAINLDISKAYDKLKWSFLKAMTRKLGFSEV